MRKALTSCKIGLSLKWLGLGILMAWLPSGWTEVTIPPLFSDHMVLQRSAKVPVWGWADPGETVHVKIAGQMSEAITDSDGKWRVDLNLKTVGRGPHELSVRGKNSLLVKDVLIGQVWLCSGQSNMGFLIKGGIGDEKEIAASTNENLREFRVDKRPSVKPEDHVDGEWRVAGPKTTGSFSAVAYYFGKVLQRELNEPVGLIHVSYGGTPIETWISAAGMKDDEELGPASQRALQKLTNYPLLKKAFETEWSQWLSRTQRADTPHSSSDMYAAPELTPEGWTQVSLPGRLNLAEAGGAVWLRKDIEIEASWAAKPWPLYLGIPTHLEEVYWNGERIGGMSLAQLRGTGMPRSYTVPARLVKAGKNVLAVRLQAPLGPMGIEGTPNQLRLSTIRPLAGKWLAKAEYEFPPLSADDRTAMPRMPDLVPDPQYVASTLFNGSIHPLAPYGISGIAWYQGESNCERAWQYRRAFPLLIQDWRRLWDDEALPFVFCQLACFQEKRPSPGESGTAELREAQALVLNLPNVGAAILIDQGEVDVHYRDKSEAGRRLALAALATAYGKNIEAWGPMYASHEKIPGAIRINFTHIEGGLTTKSLPPTYVVASKTEESKPLVPPVPGSPVQGFAICGDDRKWVWAEARIEGDSVVVSSPQVPDPVAVRYGWAENPTCNLYNAAGLPAAPFRTDDFPASTLGRKY